MADAGVGNGRMLTSGLRDELFALDGPSQGPEFQARKSNLGYMSSPDTGGSNQRSALISKIQDGVGNAAQKAEAFRTSPRFKEGRKRAAIGAAGMGALAAGLGLSNIGREEEEEVRY